jgi:hypothetical protein
MIRRTTWIVLVIFAAVLAAVLWIQKSNQDKEPEATATVAAQKLLELQEQDLKGVTIQSSDGKTLQLERSPEGEWNLVVPQPGSADAAIVQSALGQFLNSQIISSPDSLPGLEALNLESALYKLLLISQDGSQVVFNVGKETPTGSGYYVLSSNQNQVVVVNKFGMDALLNLLENPPAAATPTVEVELTEGVVQTPVP